MSVSSVVSVHDNHGLRPFSDALAAINATDRSDVAHHLAVVLPAVARLDAWLAGRPDREALSRRFYETCAEVDQGDILGRIRRKPPGYAGDYQVLDWIYTGHLSGGGLLGCDAARVSGKPRGARPYPGIRRDRRGADSH